TGRDTFGDAERGHSCRTRRRQRKGNLGPAAGWLGAIDRYENPQPFAQFVGVLARDGERSCAFEPRRRPVDVAREGAVAVAHRLYADEQEIVALARFFGDRIVDL